MILPSPEPAASPLPLLAGEFLRGKGCIMLELLPARRVRPAPAAPRGRQPPFEVEETEEGVVVRVEAPGFERNEFDVRRRGDLLSICAEHLLGQVRLAVPLPPGLAQTEAVEIVYRDGQLVLRLPKGTEAPGKPAAEIGSPPPRVAS